MKSSRDDAKQDHNTDNEHQKTVSGKNQDAVHVEDHATERDGAIRTASKFPKGLHQPLRSRSC